MVSLCHLSMMQKPTTQRLWFYYSMCSVNCKQIITLLVTYFSLSSHYSCHSDPSILLNELYMFHIRALNSMLCCQPTNEHPYRISYFIIYYRTFDRYANLVPATIIITPINEHKQHKILIVQNV
jgi:hypothetical protein